MRGLKFSIARVLAFMIIFASLQSYAFSDQTLMDATSSAELNLQLETDESTGKVFIPKQEWDEQTLEEKFGELFKVFTENNRKCEETYFNDYPLILIDDPGLKEPETEDPDTGVATSAGCIEN